MFTARSEDEPKKDGQLNKKLSKLASLELNFFSAIRTLVSAILRITFSKKTLNLCLFSVSSKTTLYTGGCVVGRSLKLEKWEKLSKLCSIAFQKAPFYWKNLKIAMRSAKDIKKYVPVCQVCGFAPSLLTPPLSREVLFHTEENV